MNILYLSMSFSAKSDGLYNNLVDALIESGHHVTMVTSAPERDATNFENIKPGLDLLSVKTGDPFDSSMIKKGINQVMLNSYFKKAIKSFLDNEQFDLILYATPPITLCDTILFCKNKYKAKTFLMLKDIFPQNAADLGMMSKSGPVFKYFRHLEKKYYKHSDYIGCMSQGNADFVRAHNKEVDTSKLHIFYNSIRIDEKEEAVFNEDSTVFMFGGNLGKPQNIDMLLNVAKRLGGYDKARFQLIGSGTEVDKIKSFIDDNNLKNIIFRETLPRKEYEKVLKMTDVGLISLDPRFTIPNIPSRFQSYLKLSKPVLAITDTVTDLKDMIRKGDCGWWCDAENEDSIIAAIKDICENKEEQIRRGANGYEYLINEFDVKTNVRQIEEFLEKSK